MIPVVTTENHALNSTGDNIMRTRKCTTPKAKQSLSSSSLFNLSSSKSPRTTETLARKVSSPRTPADRHCRGLKTNLFAWVLGGEFVLYFVLIGFFVFHSFNYVIDNNGPNHKRIRREYGAKKHMERDKLQAKLVPPKISYELVSQKELPYEQSFVKNDKYKCTESSRIPIHPTLESLLLFNTKITSSLKIIVMGDSLGIQIGEGLAEASGGTPPDTLDSMVYGDGEDKDILSISATQGGGFVVGWRLNGMFLAEGRRREPPPASGGGWSFDNMIKLREHHIYKSRALESQPTSTVSVRGSEDTDGGMSMDAMIFRPSFPWVKLENITKKKLAMGLTQAHKHFGVSTVIITSIPFNNNGLKVGIEALKAKNDEIRQFVDEFEPKADGSGVRYLLFLDFFALAQELLEFNGAQLGLQPHEVFGRKIRLSTERYSLAAQLCGELESRDENSSCKRNSFSVDGMHWCWGTMSGRVNGSIACLLSCVYNHDADGRGPDPVDVKVCEDQCNRRFMSLDPIQYGVQQ